MVASQGDNNSLLICCGKVFHIFSSQLWTQFFDDMLNPKTEEKQYLPSLLKWRTRLLALFDEVFSLFTVFNWMVIFWFIAEWRVENRADKGQRNYRHEVHGEMAKMLLINHSVVETEFSSPHLPWNEIECAHVMIMVLGHMSGLLDQASSVFLYLSTPSKIFISQWSETLY